MGLRILDPAMGSGHFLVAAGQVVSNFVVELLNRTEWPNDAIDSDPLVWKRRVVEHCLYGVDVNPLAVELAKLALWISSASEGKPLTFLNHHLKIGNSLYGAPLNALEALPTAKQPREEPLFREIREAVIKAILSDLAEIMAADSDTITAVKRKENLQKHAHAKATRLRDIANVWVASLLGISDDDGESLTEAKYAKIHSELTTNYTPEQWEHYVKTDAILRRAREIANDKTFFHWELEFADAVVDNVCQFDIVAANPPYVAASTYSAVSKLYATSKCNDLYAWLMEKAFDLIGERGYFGTVVPLSLMFSRSFKSLRRIIVEQKGVVSIASFDIRPSSLFGSSEAPNSQRTCIFLLRRTPTDNNRVFATNLLRWLGEERPYLLSKLQYAEITPFASEAGFPKIGDPCLAEFWATFRTTERKIADITQSILSEGVRDDAAEWFLIVPRAVRYFLSAFPVRVDRNKVLTLTFPDQKSRDLAAVLLNSNVHYWYWLTNGDGFATNADIVANFPAPDLPQQAVEDLASRLYDALGECATYQANTQIPGFNFNRRMDLLLEMDNLIVKHVAPDVKMSRDIFAQFKSNSFLRPLDLMTSIETDEMEID